MSNRFRSSLRLGTIAGCLLVLAAGYAIVSYAIPGEPEPAAEGALARPAYIPREDVALIDGYRTNLYKEGKLQEQIVAESAQMFDDDRIIDLRKLHVEFYKDSRRIGSLSGLRGRLWTIADPVRHAERNDLLLEGQVSFDHEEGWRIESPAMHYTAADMTIRSNQSCQLQRKLKDGYLIGKARTMELLLSVEEGNFERCTLRGEAVLEKSKEPQL